MIWFLTAAACSQGMPNISQPLHVQVRFIMSTFKKVVPIETPNIPFMKGVTRYTSPLAIFYCTFSSIFGPMHSFQLFDSSLCLTSIEPNLAICSIRKLQMKWCLSFLNQTLNDSARFVVILSHLCFGNLDIAQCSGSFSSTHLAKASLYFRSSNMETL